MLRLLVSFLLSHKRFILILILVIGAVWVNSILTQRPTQSTTDAIELTLEYEDIVPGESKHSDLVGKYGVFDSQYSLDDLNVYTYTSPNSRYAPDTFYLKGDYVVLKELFFNPLERQIKKEQLIDRYGEPTLIRYTPSSDSTNTVYIYPSAGIAFYVLDDKHVVRLQQFIPTTEAGYLSGWGSQLVQEKPKPVDSSSHVNK